MRDVDEDEAQSALGCLVYPLVILFICYGVYSFF